MPASRTFVLHSTADWHEVVGFVRQHAGRQVEAGRPLAVRVHEYRPKGSDAARALMWVWLGEIAHAVVVDGRHYVADVWHVHFKREFLPDATRAGVPKWRLLPDGERELFMSTTDLDRDEMSEYLSAIQAWAATEHGLQLESVRG